VTFTPQFPFGTDTLGDQVEAQYIYRREWLNLVAGGWDTGIDEMLGLVGFPKAPRETDAQRAYVYTNVKFPTSVTWTLGLSYDDYQRLPVEVEKTSPKLGVQWDITRNLSVRAAAFQWVKPPLLADRTLEPTQVSGFNQVFDNSNGDVARHRAVGADWRLTKRLFVGGEATWRTIEVPIEISFLPGEITALSEEWKEQLHRAYVFWTPFPRLSISGQVIYDTFDSELGLLTSFFVTPEHLKTVSVPIGVRYFDPSGFFAGVVWTYVDQDVVRTPDAKLFQGLSDGKSNFDIVDASIGWRFPKRFGVATLTARNLFDTKFRFQDDNFREFRLDVPSAPLYVPERQVVGRVSLYF
jgi:outer membrane receptor protein involved in Fe transport